MINHLIFFIFLLLSAGFYSNIEIQIEGNQGWAAGLPTWRIENRLTKFLLGSKPLTGYHLFFLLFIITIAHLPYGLQIAPFSLQNELRILSFIILFFIVEDFLWFVMNPAFGINKFKAENVWWHDRHWWWIMPREYWIFGPVGLALYILSYTFI
jgi:hypothetical protein